MRRSLHRSKAGEMARLLVCSTFAGGSVFSHSCDQEDGPFLYREIR